MNSFKKSISNKNFRKLLADPDNILLLEDLIVKEGLVFKELYGKYYQNGGKLNYGPLIDKNELPDLLDEVKTEVDTFLDTSHVSKCSIEYNCLFDKNMTFLWSLNAISLLTLSQYIAALPTVLYYAYLITERLSNPSDSYNPFIKHISLNKISRVEAIPTIAHEYAHHVVNKQGLVKPLITNYNRRSFNEGFARGVERHISNLYREKEDNIAFLNDYTFRIGEELGNAYVWVHLQNGIPLNCKFDLHQHGIEIITKDLKKSINHYDIGTSLIYLHELKNGKEIYKEMAHGRYEF